MGLKYYADIKNAQLSDLLRKVIIKNDNQLMVFSDYRYQYLPDTGRSIGAYFMFYQGGPIDHVTHVPGPVARSKEEIDYNEACTAGMDL